MDIYIKPVKKFLAAGKKIVYLKDIAEVFSSGGDTEKIKNIIVFKIPDNNEKTYLLSIVDIVKSILAVESKATVNNVGEMDILIEYKVKPERENKIVLWLKIAAIFAVLFFGAATAIMSFHNDGEIPSILKNYYFMFFKEYIDNPPILTIPYSIGLAIGITVFFNHFSRIYITKDPTPIEVQMTTYENETITSIVDNLSKEGGNNGDS